MREIARQAGVGVATLYRHFPTREALVDAVYQDQVVRLTAGARDLLAAHPPARALRLWMDLFADWLATKRGMTGTLLAMVDAGDISLAHTRGELLAAIATILDAGIAAGQIRADTSAEDVSAAVLGLLAVSGERGNPEQAQRLLDVLMDGLKDSIRTLSPYFARASGVTGVKKLTRLPSGSRTSRERLPQGRVFGSATTSEVGIQAARRCQRASTSSTRNSMITLRLAPGAALPGANSGTVPVLPIARVAPAGVASSAKSGVAQVAGRAVAFS